MTNVSGLFNFYLWWNRYFSLKSSRLPQRQHAWIQEARPNQLPPDGHWHTWIIIAGRGFGKTRAGAEAVRMAVESGQYRRIALIGQTRNEAKNVMVFGASGIVSVYQKDEDPYAPQWSPDALHWENGAQAHLYSGDHLDKLRGPQFDLVWIDEWAKFRNPEELWNQVQMTLRLGRRPRLIITTTPRSFGFLRKLMEQPGVVITRGSTFDNSDHLSPGFINQVHAQYSQTTLGSQELYGEVLVDREGALWKRSMIQHEPPPHNDFQRLVLAIDPATTHHEGSDETGIVMAGLMPDGRVYVVDDLSGRHSPADWGQRVVDAYFKHKVDRVVVETNKGGDLVVRVLQTLSPHIAIRHVHATRGKITRAEPVAALYEQGKVKHMRPFHKLEQQMCEYTATTSQSPDRMDALVWALTDLLLEKEAAPPRVWLHEGGTQ